MNSSENDLLVLLNDPTFRRWVLDDSVADAKTWETWQAEDSTRRLLVEQARSVLLQLRGAPLPMSDGYVALKLQQALVEAKRREAVLTAELPRRRLRWGAVAGRVAASIVLVLGLGWGAFRLLTNSGSASAYERQVGQVRQHQELVEVRNDQAKPKLVQLADGSSIILRPHSRLSYPTRFASQKREVYLTGEAFFEVAKNPEQPFFVYSSDLIIKVLGTSFSVKGFAEDPQVVVVVKTGKVSVFAQADQRASQLKANRELAGLVLTPNQQVTFQREEMRLVRSLVARPTLLAIPIEAQRFEFNATPLSEVFATLQKAYGVSIVFDEELVTGCTITASLGDEPLFEKLRWICAITEATYEMTDGQIIVSAKPCQPKSTN